MMNKKIIRDGAQRFGKTMMAVHTLNGLLSLALAMTWIVSAQTTSAQLSDTSISFQARLNGQNGQPLPNGNYNLSFRFWDGPAPGGNAVSTNVLVPNVPVANGVATTTIPVDPNWFNGQTRYLGISVNGGAELLPRVLVTAVPYSLSTRGLTVDDSGQVGIGTTNLPTDLRRILEVNGDIKLSASSAALRDKYDFWMIGYTGASNSENISIGNGNGVNSDQTMTFCAGAFPRMEIAANGDVGIGTLAPQEKLDVAGNLVVRDDSGIPVLRTDPTGNVVVGSYLNDQAHYPGGYYGGNLVIIGPNTPRGTGSSRDVAFDFSSGGSALIRAYQGQSWDTYMDLMVNSYSAGKDAPSVIEHISSSGVTINGLTQTKVLQITGGSDLAEHVNVTAPGQESGFKIQPGMVVSIDPSGNRKFKLSDKPYDRNRVGIISGGKGVKPGLMLEDQGNPSVSGKWPIALSGQVWCRADASYGSIQPGNLLTTSSTPGYAMKVTDFNKARFAVLGQALTGLRKGRGWVEVLVGKQ